MRELPGFYFDEEKKRYFPSTSGPASGRKVQAASSSTKPNSQVTHRAVAQPRKATQLAKYTLYDCLLKQQRSVNRISRSIVTHQITCEQLNHASQNQVKLNNPCSSVPFTSFCAYENTEKELTFALGDQRGYCFAYRNGVIHPEYIMTSQYTSFGPRPAILLHNVNFPDTLHVFMPAQLQDVRTSQLNGKSLVIGMRKQALYFPDINVPEITNALHVGSDVFALCQENFTVWAGARNGTVRVFDTRISQGMEILHKRFSSADDSDHPRTSITHLRRVREFELVISTLDGRIELYDTRFIRQTKHSNPSLTLEGHIDRNQVIHNLGLAIDPSQEYLFMAGQDCRVRAWSLRTGKQIKVYPNASSSQSALLNREFSAPVLGMQTTSYRNQNTLWLISGSTFEQYEIP